MDRRKISRSLRHGAGAKSPLTCGIGSLQSRLTGDVVRPDVIEIVPIVHAGWLQNGFDILRPFLEVVHDDANPTQNAMRTSSPCITALMIYIPGATNIFLCPPILNRWNLQALNLFTGTDLLIPSSEPHQLANLRLAHVFDAQLHP